MATLDSLFLSSAEIELGNTKLYLRALSDFDLQARDEYALLALAKKNKELSDPASNDYLRYLGWTDAATDEQLQDMVLRVASYDFQRQALSDIQPKLIPMPDDATDEERADILTKREEESVATQEARKDSVKAKNDALSEELKLLDHWKLLARARRSQANFQERDAYIRAVEQYTLYAICFKDSACKERLFSKPDDVSESTTPPARQAIMTRFSENLDKLSALDLKYFLSTGGSETSSKPPNGTTEEFVGQATQATNEPGK